MIILVHSIYHDHDLCVAHYSTSVSTICMVQYTGIQVVDVSGYHGDTSTHSDIDHAAVFDFSEDANAQTRARVECAQHTSILSRRAAAFCG